MRVKKPDFFATVIYICTAVFQRRKNWSKTRFFSTSSIIWPQSKSRELKLGVILNLKQYFCIGTEKPNAVRKLLLSDDQNEQAESGAHANIG